MSPLTQNDNIEEKLIDTRLAEVRARIAAAEHRYDRVLGSVTLVAVSKAQPAAAIRAAYRAGQRHFGESYLQEALLKQTELTDLNISWHFVGAIQSNKTRDIAQNFAWIHGVDRLKIAERLHEQRPQTLPRLDVCIQVNVGAERQKAGVSLMELSSLMEQLLKLTRLRVRGLMALPPLSKDFHEQRGYFHELRLALAQLQDQGYPLDTLSMGMSTDLEAAIAEGATLVRVGTALFGERPRNP